MRTTVDIPDALYRQLKGRAASEGCSVKELILRGVEQQLRGNRNFPRRVNDPPLIRSKRPGSIELTNAKIFEIIPFP